MRSMRTWAALVVILAGCAQQAFTELQPAITVKAAPEPDGVRILGTTNLPDGTELMVTLSAEGYRAQDKPVVQAGTFSSAAFTDRGQPLRAGTYEVSVTTGVASIQSEAFKRLYGPHGEGLSGPLVERGGDLFPEDRMVKLETRLAIPKH